MITKVVPHDEFKESYHTALAELNLLLYRRVELQERVNRLENLVECLELLSPPKRKKKGTK